MKFIYTLFFIFLLSLVSVSAQVVFEPGQELFDGENNYTVVAQFSAETIRIEAGEIYLNDEPLCDTEYTSSIFSVRVCPSTSKSNFAKHIPEEIDYDYSKIFDVQEEVVDSDNNDQEKETETLIDDDLTQENKEFIQEEQEDVVNEVPKEKDDKFEFLKLPEKIKSTSLIVLVVGSFAIATFFLHRNIETEEHIHSKYVDVKTKTTGEKNKKI